MKKALPSKDLTSKLKAYSMAAGALAVGVGDANANIIYTDEVPDFAGVIGSQYFLDLNNDGNDDFRIYHNGSSNLYISPLTSQNEVLGSGGATFAYPFALNSGATISSGAGGFFNNGYAGGFQSLNYGSCSFGNWCSVTDRYIGLRFSIGGNIHYGWVRLDVNQAGSVWSVKDYAYEDIIGGPILAGDMGGAPGAATPANGVAGMDVANNGNGTDAEVSFNAGSDETTINEYRVMVVKTPNAATFDLAAAQAVAMADYTVVAPSGSPTYTQVMAAGATDVDGDAIAQSVSYTAFVMVEADGVIATVDALSSGSVPFMLDIPVDTASNVMAADIGDNGGGLDLEVSFDGAVDESGLAEYRVMVVKATNAMTFDDAAAAAVPMADYTAIAPTGAGTYQQALAAAATDVDGDQVANGVAYRVFVYNAANGTTATLSMLSMMSNEITLLRSADPTSNIGGIDVADIGTGMDMQVSFDAAVDETTIGEYRVIITKGTSTNFMNLALANAAQVGNYYAVLPVGSSTYTFTLPAVMNDYTGDAIVSGQNYNVFILSVADGVFANLNTLSGPSSTVRLEIESESVTPVTAADVSNLADGRDLQINFNAIADETTIDSYRILVVKAANSAGFDQAAANAATDFYTLMPDGSSSYSQTLDDNDRDVDGDLIVENQPYNVFILSMSNGNPTTSNGLSTPSNEITLTNSVGIAEANLTEVKVSVVGQQLTVNASGDLNGAQLTVLDLTGRTITTGQVNGNRTVMNLNNASSGIYLLRVDNNKQAITQKFLVR